MIKKNPERVAAFEAAMFDIEQKAAAKGYNARDYKTMLYRDGIEETARKCVLKKDGVPSGVFRLMELGIPEISVEAVVVEFADLFADEPALVAGARERLRWMQDPVLQANAAAIRRTLQSRTSR